MDPLCTRFLSVGFANASFTCLNWTARLICILRNTHGTYT